MRRVVRWNFSPQISEVVSVVLEVAAALVLEVAAEVVVLAAEVQLQGVQHPVIAHTTVYCNCFLCSGFIAASICYILRWLLYSPLMGTRD